jgi:hypothetical protein
MTTETSENGTKPPETGDAESAGEFPSCDPGCDCGEPTGKGNSKLKVAMCLVVVVAVAAILIFKTTNVRQTPSLSGANEFSTPLAKKGAVTSSSGQQGGSGAQLSAIADLNTIADKLDTVFLIIPGKENVPASKETGSVLASVERILNRKGLSTGIFTLKTTSPDYPDVTAKVTPPGVAVLSKGGGIGFVSGTMSETKLMQAYVASTSGGGCCPPGGGKATVPCN